MEGSADSRQGPEKREIFLCTIILTEALFPGEEGKAHASQFIFLLPALIHYLLWIKAELLQRRFLCLGVDRRTLRVTFTLSSPTLVSLYSLVYTWPLGPLLSLPGRSGMHFFYLGMSPWLFSVPLPLVLPEGRPRRKSGAALSLSLKWKSLG